MASNIYTQHATPNADPLVFSEATRANIRRVHTFSGQAVTITQKTTGMIHNLIDSVAYKVGGSGTKTPSPSGSSTPGVERSKKRKLLNRVLLSTNMILSAVEQSATTIIKGGSDSIAQGVHHKYGAHAGEAAESIGQSVQNVSVVYIDARGVGRRAVLKRMGKGVFKAKMGKRNVVIGAEVPPGVPVGGASTVLGSRGSGLAPAPARLPNRSPSPSSRPGLGSNAAPPPSYQETMLSGKPAPPQFPPRN